MFYTINFMNSIRFLKSGIFFHVQQFRVKISHKSTEQCTVIWPNQRHCAQCTIYSVNRSHVTFHIFFQKSSPARTLCKLRTFFFRHPKQTILFHHCLITGYNILEVHFIFLPNNAMSKRFFFSKRIFLTENVLHE